MIELWDVAKGQRLTMFEGHTSEIEAVAFSSDGETLVSASWDRTIRLWDVDTGGQLSTFIEGSDWLTAVAYSPDGETLVSGSRSGEVRLWSASTGRHNGTIRLWRASGEQLQETSLKGHTDGITAMALSPNGRILASGTYGRLLASGSWEAPILLWNTDTQRLETVLKGHTKQVNALAFSPNGGTLVSVGGDKTIRLWRSDTEQSSLVVDPQPLAILTADTDGFGAVAFSPDGKILASTEKGKIQVWDVETDQQQANFEGASETIYSLAFSPDGSTLADGGRDGTVRLWDTETGELKTTLEETYNRT